MVELSIQYLKTRVSVDRLIVPKLSEWQDPLSDPCPYDTFHVTISNARKHAITPSPATKVPPQERIQRDIARDKHFVIHHSPCQTKVMLLLDVQRAWQRPATLSDSCPCDTSTAAIPNARKHAITSSFLPSCWSTFALAGSGQTLRGGQTAAKNNDAPHQT